MRRRRLLSRPERSFMKAPSSWPSWQPLSAATAARRPPPIPTAASSTVARVASKLMAVGAGRQRQPGAAMVCGPGDKLPAIDYQCPLMSLGLIAVTR